VHGFEKMITTSQCAGFILFVNFHYTATSVIFVTVVIRSYPNTLAREQDKHP